MVVEMNCRRRGAFANVKLIFFYCSIFYVKFMLILDWKLHSRPLGFEPMNRTPSMFLWGNKVSFELSSLVLYLVHFFQIVYYSFFFIRSSFLFFVYLIVLVSIPLIFGIQFLMFHFHLC